MAFLQGKIKFQKIINNGHRIVALAVLLLATATGFSAPITVHSLSELLPYLSQDSVQVKMAPGVYKIDFSNAGSGRLFDNASLLRFTGSNSTYDFTGVKIEVSTLVFQSFGNVAVQEVVITGSNLHLKNLVIEDIGDSKPRRTALGVWLEGSDNIIEGFHLTVRGSFPYAYGDIFGKGSGYVIKHYKHAAILVKGDRNTVRNCTIIHRAYGHGIFCQGSVDALIEGCYIEGEMRSTDEVLAEAGTGSPADGVDFMSVWGYKVPPGYMFSLQEDGIRAYNSGSYGDGQRNTKNMIVRNCTIKNMRSGVTIGFCDGTKYVENCVSLGCEGAFWVGTEGEIVNCAGDAKYGSLYGAAYNHDRDCKIDLRVLDCSNSYGHSMLAYLGGSNHEITLKSDVQDINPQLKIMVSGIKDGLRNQEINPTYNDFTSNGIKIHNYTNYPVVLEEKSSNCTGESVGPIIDNGSNNSIDSIAASNEALPGQPQFIYFPEIPEKMVGDEDFWPGAMATSGLDITYTSSNPEVAIIADGKIHITGQGTTEISALQAGNEVFAEAASVSRILQVQNKVSVSVKQQVGPVLNKVQVYPNPVRDMLYVYQNQFDARLFELFDVDGRLVLSGKLTSGDNPINLTGMLQGIYVLKITDGQNEKRVKIRKL